MSGRDAKGPCEECSNPIGCMKGGKRCERDAGSEGTDSRGIEDSERINQPDQTEIVRYAVALTAKPLPKAKITPVGIRQLAEEVVRADIRLRRTLDDCRHWRERAISAEQALGLYGAVGDA